MAINIEFIIMSYVNFNSIKKETSILNMIFKNVAQAVESEFVESEVQLLANVFPRARGLRSSFGYLSDGNTPTYCHCCSSLTCGLTEVCFLLGQQGHFVTCLWGHVAGTVAVFSSWACPQLITFCVWGLLFAGCRFVVPVVFGVCPQWLRLVLLVV